MQKIKNNAFSFIELLVVISILAILTVFGVMSFGDKIDSLKTKNILGEIAFDIKQLDNKVFNKEIFDYKITFIKGKKYYLVNENIFDRDYSLKLDNLDDNTGIGRISFSGATSGSGIIKYYENIKFQKGEEVAYNSFLTWSFNKEQKYKISGSYSGAILNNILINYFDKKQEFKLVGIYTNNLSNLDQINIKNILGKKQFGNNSGINKIILIFENDLGKKYNLEINK